MYLKYRELIMSIVLKNKKGVTYLHYINALTTFSFAILYSSLYFYLTKVIGLSQFQSNGVVGFFLASNFILHLISGYIGDRLLSNRLLLAISIIFQTIGAFVLSTSLQSLVYIGLSLFLIGCGLGSTCLNCLLTQQFQADEDQSRESAFFYNYSAMNIGFFSGFMFCGFIDLHDNYEKIFEFSNLINFITVFLIFRSWKFFNTKNEQVKKTKKLSLKLYIPGIISVPLIVPILMIGFYFSGIANYLILSIGVIALSYVFYIGISAKDRIVKGKIYSYLILTVASIIFWMLYFVAPMGLTQFLKHNVNIDIFGYSLPPQWMMNFNSVCVILGSPLLVILFSKLRKKNIAVSISSQFFFSLLFISISFFALSMGILNANQAGLSSGNWILLHYTLQSIGELLIAPVGYAMIGKLAPKKLQGIMMGMWMMTSGISATLSHHFSNIMTKSGSLNPLISNQHYLDAFNQLGLYSLVGALMILVFSSLIEKNINNLAVKAIEPATSSG